MHGSRASVQALLDSLLQGIPKDAKVGCAVCAPFPYLALVAERLRGSPIAWGAQNVSEHAQGAYTGEVSAAMLAEFGCRYVLVGHSERRQLYGESDAQAAAKFAAVKKAGMTPILCVGETLEEREAGQTTAVVKRQMSAVIHTLTHCISQVVVAYEPVWAIGTGKTATPDEAQAVHALLRAQLHAATEHAGDMKILYGGSVKADNAAQLFAQPDIDGGLIGGASLKVAEFAAICRAASL